jgi:hypothetical protein
MDVAFATSPPWRSNMRLSTPGSGLAIQGKSWWLITIL